MQMIERKQPGRGRHNRVNMSMETDYETKLNRLAIACGNMAPTTLAYIMVKLCLDDPQIIAFLQEEFATIPDYGVIPVREHGGWKFEVVGALK